MTSGKVAGLLMPSRTCHEAPARHGETGISRRKLNNTFMLRRAEGPSRSMGGILLNKQPILRDSAPRFLRMRD